MPPSKSPTKSPAKKRPAATPPATKTEAEARTFYYYLFAKRIVKTLGIAILLYAFSAHLIPASPVATKLQFMHTYSLGFVYAAWYILYITRLYAGLNANGARAPTGIDRPDQHAYEVVGGGTVKMVTEGDAGRFNRAQRGAYNMDETMPIFISGLLLNGAVLGPAVVLIAAMYSYGAVLFCNTYTAGGSRINGFLYKASAESVSAQLALLIAVKALAGPALPY